MSLAENLCEPSRTVRISPRDYLYIKQLHSRQEVLIEEIEKMLERRSDIFVELMEIDHDIKEVIDRAAPGDRRPVHRREKTVHIVAGRDERGIFTSLCGRRSFDSSVFTNDRLKTSCVVCINSSR